MEKRITVLGGGPAGLAMAMKLLQRQVPGWKVTVIEQKSQVGGMAASFEEQGLFLDYGSHRLHPATSAEIMNDFRSLLGEDLRRRPRNGRIRLMNHFVKFPLSPVNLMLHTPPSFFAGILADMLTKPFRKSAQGEETFADVLLRGLGPTVCNHFYFPYAQKLWGLKPEDISVIQAQRRVSANSVGKIIKKVFSFLPGLKKKDTGVFYYPAQGFGQLSNALRDKIVELGGEIRLNSTITGISAVDGGGYRINVRGDHESGQQEAWLESDFIFSTIPVTVLTRLLRPGAPETVVNAAKRLKFRSMVLHYLVLETDQFTPYDAHYIPQAGIAISRISEPKNYSNNAEPTGLTAICSEIPCNIGDDTWNMPDEALTSKVIDEFSRIGLPVNMPVQKAFSRKQAFVYPIYDRNFDAAFAVLDAYLNDQPGLISLGRQGLFAHDNTHHTMETAYKACECLGDDLRWNGTLWQQYRDEFSRHVVED